MTTETLKELYKKYLGDKPLAVEWLELYTMLVHKADDLVDEVTTTEQKMDTMLLSRMVWSHPFYLEFKSQLSLVDELATQCYLDAEKWKSSEEHWKQLSAEVLRHQCYNMFFAVILLTCGRKALREVSEPFREYTHLKHLNDSPEVFTNLKVA